ncbi:MAG: glutamate--cysteine ligase, partial [Geodermatophilaceae bacterium]|nr:glutamate--cysteine ligase [Geodermatophilaceae bacterium]
MGDEVASREFSRQDRQLYRAKVRRCLDVFARMLEASKFDSERPMTGLEIEFNLIDEQHDPAMRNADVLQAIANEDFQTELGQFNIEINVKPRGLAGESQANLEADLRSSLNYAEEKSREAGAHITMIGILPTLTREHLSAESISANPRYALLNEQIFAARG